MGDVARRERRRSAPGEVETRRDDADAEGTLARAVAAMLPVGCIVTAVVVGAAAGLGPAILVLAFGALVGTIALLWASLRTLSGDAPLSAELQRAASHHHDASAMAERKRRVLRALKDLESEHAIGKIDDADYATIAARYREEAKDVMRELDERVAPSRAEAEKVAREYLAKRGLAGVPAPTAAPVARTGQRVACQSCGASNEHDAAFCKQCGSAMPRSGGRTDAAK
jgi:hypothetical protein